MEGGGGSPGRQWMRKRVKPYYSCTHNGPPVRGDGPNQPVRRRSSLLERCFALATPLLTLGAAILYSNIFSPGGGTAVI